MIGRHHAMRVANYRSPSGHRIRQIATGKHLFEYNLTPFPPTLYYRSRSLAARPHGAENDPAWV
jgi:hypothetical protein